MFSALSLGALEDSLLFYDPHVWVTGHITGMIIGTMFVRIWMYYNSFHQVISWRELSHCSEAVFEGEDYDQEFGGVGWTGRSSEAGGGGT